MTGDRDAGQSPSLPAIAGYPHLTVPMGQIQGLPVGLSFIGPAWSEDRLLAHGYAFEQAAKAREPPTYILSLETTPPANEAAAPGAVSQGEGGGRGAGRAVPHGCDARGGHAMLRFPGGYIAEVHAPQPQ